MERANNYTELHYAFATLHIHGAIHKERGLLTSGGKEIKNSQQILQLLEAVWKPRAIAIIHCHHQLTRPAKETDWQTGFKSSGSLKRSTEGRRYSNQSMLCPPCPPGLIRV
jgi:hypothetical protein